MIEYLYRITLQYKVLLSTGSCDKNLDFDSQIGQKFRAHAHCKNAQSAL